MSSGLASAGDTGVPPRPSSSDYPVHQQTNTAWIAAAVVAPDRMGIGKQYVVVEVAVYPDDGQTLDVELSDFALKIGNRIIRADSPWDVPAWQEKQVSTKTQPVEVTTETGVSIGHSSDPVNGRTRTVGTYTGVSVATGQPDPPPPPSSHGPDPRERALPTGPTKTAVAGYLYFRRYEPKRKSETLELKYSKDDASATLSLPK